MTARRLAPGLLLVLSCTPPSSVTASAPEFRPTLEAAPTLESAAAPESAPAPEREPQVGPTPKGPGPTLAPAPTIPEPHADLAALPTDVRLPDRAAWQAGHRRDCRAFPASPCELAADLDGDGAVDRIVKSRAIASKLAGFAVLWGAGGVSIIGAGASSRVLHTDVYSEGTEMSWSETEQDFGFLQRWAIVKRVADGFVADRGVPGSSKRSLRLPAPDVTGAGIWLDGGDAAEILYWDGVRWRRLVVGF